MKRTVTAVLMVTLGLGSCKKAPRRTVVLDAWWSRDYARSACWQANAWWKENRELVARVGCDLVTSCPEMMPRLQACIGDPAAEVGEFEAQFASVFATDASCKGITLARFAGPADGSPEVLKRTGEPAWWLFLDFQVGQTEQPWTMNHTPDSTSEQYYGHTAGKGTPRAIAHTVCGIVNGKGGRLQD